MTNLNEQFALSYEIYAKENWGINSHMTLINIATNSLIMEICLRVRDSQDILIFEEALSTFRRVIGLEISP